MIAVQNSSGQPQVVTTSGRVLGAGEFGAYDVDERLGALLDDGTLIRLTGTPSKDTDPQAAAAMKAATKKTEKES